MKITSRKMPESVIYLLLWLMFLVIPFITNNYNIKGGFLRICYDWLRIIPFLIVFLVNNFLLMRKFLFRGRTGLYISSLILVVIAVSISFQVLNPVLHRNDPKVLEERILKDPQYGREEMNPVKPSPFNSNTPVSPEVFTPGNDPTIRENQRFTGVNPSLFVLINTMIISFLIAGFNTAIAVTSRWFTEEQARKEIEKEHMQSELAFLQNQVSPHFFMNTLNNIHALIEQDQKLAQNAVLKLSEMMRYLLYESGRGTTTLSREIEFLRSYIKLMQLRVDASVKVDFELPDKFDNVNLPPLLFISFIENAFKHGVSYREDSALSFRLLQQKGVLEFTAINTVSSYQNSESLVQHGGIGLENIKKRLDLLYSGKHQLIIESTGNEFKVRLIIPT